jgi:hypothetical protein
MLICDTRDFGIFNEFDGIGAAKILSEYGVYLISATLGNSPASVFCQNGIAVIDNAGFRVKDNIL